MSCGTLESLLHYLMLQFPYSENKTFLATRRWNVEFDICRPFYSKCDAAPASGSASETADPLAPHGWVLPGSGVASLYDVPMKEQSFTAPQIASLPNSLLPGLIQMSFLSIVVHSICFLLVKMCQFLGTLGVPPNTASYFHSMRSQNTGRMSGTLKGSKDPKVL